MIGIIRISELAKNPDGTDISTPVVNFGEVRRAQLAKTTLLTSTWCPWDLFSSSEVCPDAKERMGNREQWVATAPIYLYSAIHRVIIVLKDRATHRVAKRIAPSLSVLKGPSLKIRREQLLLRDLANNLPRCCPFLHE